MILELPEPIAAYFTADKGNSETFTLCFANDATVHDEGKTYHGADAIGAWKAATTTAYQYTSTPIALTESSGRLVVTARLEGNFSGSPINLDYAFTLRDDRIQTLEIG